MNEQAMRAGLRVPDDPWKRKHDLLVIELLRAIDEAAGKPLGHITYGALLAPVRDVVLRHAGRPNTPRPPIGDRAQQLLTKQQLLTLNLIAHGHSNREAARELGLTEETVKTHLRGLYKRLGARDRAHAVLIGVQHGLIHVDREVAAS